MEIIKVKTTGKCESCGKDTEVAEVKMQNRIAILCKKDHWTIAKVTLKEDARVTSKASS